MNWLDTILWWSGIVFWICIFGQVALACGLARSLCGEDETEGYHGDAEHEASVRDIYDKLQEEDINDI